VSRIRIVFMGTPEFAIPSLQALLQDEHYQVVGVVTQPDRPAGRKLELKPSPVKALAQQKGLPVLSPEKVNTPEILEQIQEWGAEVAVVVAFGQLLSRKLLGMFQYGCVNIHSSLLPRWRGAAPMQRSLMAGDTLTGVSLQKMVYELDAGDVLGERRITVTDEMDVRHVHDTLSQLAGELLHVELMDYVRGNLVGSPQDASFVTVAPKIRKEEALIHWQVNTFDVFNLVRGLTLGPVAYTTLKGLRVKIWRTRRATKSDEATPGKLQIEGERILVRCGDGWLELLEVQPESKKAMSAAEFARGYLSGLSEEQLGFDVSL
jgi:methionyl-tRNA formyltransferase